MTDYSKVYGRDPRSLVEDYEHSISKGIFILGTLSDIQEMVVREYPADEIRKEINCIKYLLAEKVLAKDEAGRLL